MASRRKTFRPERHAPSLQHVAAEFMGKLLDGTIKATNIQLDANGRIVAYDDPDPDRPGAPPDSPTGKAAVR